MPGKKCPNCGNKTFYGKTCTSCGYTAHFGPGPGKPCPICGKRTLKEKGDVRICNNCGTTFTL